MILTDEQKAALQKAKAELTKAFPDLSLRDIIEGPVADDIFGALPAYSGLKQHKVNNVSTVMVGSFVICHGMSDFPWERVVVLIERTKKGANGQKLYGVTGGFTDLDKTTASTYTPASTQGEQPAQGAVRELREELVDDQGQPVLDIDPARLTLIKTGTDYRAVAKGGNATQYSGHAVELTDAEMNSVRQHMIKLQTDPSYKNAMTLQSHNEVNNVLLVTLDCAVAMESSQFAHPHELETLKELNQKLTSPHLNKGHVCLNGNNIR